MAAARASWENGAKRVKRRMKCLRRLGAQRGLARVIRYLCSVQAPPVRFAMEADFRFVERDRNREGGTPTGFAILCRGAQSGALRTR